MKPPDALTLATGQGSQDTSTLPFTAEVLASVIAGYNRAIWPAQVLAVGLALAMLWLALRSRRDGAGRAGPRLLGLGLAAAWAWTGAVFFGRYLAAIDFVAPAYGALFGIQALLLAWTGGYHGRIAPEPQAGPIGWVGGALVAYALAGHPLIAALAGGGLTSAAVVGLAPGPTAVFTLGVLLLAGGGAPLHLAVVPVLWSLIAGVIAWTLGVAEDLALPLFGLGSLALLIGAYRRRRDGSALSP